MYPLPPWGAPRQGEKEKGKKKRKSLDPCRDELSECTGLNSGEKPKLQLLTLLKLALHLGHVFLYIKHPGTQRHVVLTRIYVVLLPISLHIL